MESLAVTEAAAHIYHYCLYAYSGLLRPAPPVFIKVSGLKTLLRNHNLQVCGRTTTALFVA